MTGDMTSQTVSPWALPSMLLSVLSLGACLVSAALALTVNVGAAFVIAFLPLVGLAGAICGFIALRQISRSGGMLAGRPPALAGLFIGLLTAVLQGAFAAGAMMTYSSLHNHLAPVVNDFHTAAAAGDLQRARPMLAPGTSSIADERLRFFVQTVEERCGRVTRVGAGVDTVLRGMGTLRTLAGNADPSRAVPQERPMPLDFHANRVVLAYTFVDQDALGSDQVLLIDILILPGDGSAITLREDGPAAGLARYFSLDVVEPPAP